MKLDHLTRQLDIIPVGCLSQPITVIGAGAIGSFTVLSLAKMGFRNITVYDFDKVSEENMNCQWYRISDIGRPKVEALKDAVHSYSGVEINENDKKYEGGRLHGIVISAVDSMSVRKTIWQSVKDSPFVSWLIDPRMASEYAVSFVMNPNDDKDKESYEKTLHSDEGGVQERCTAKATIYTSTMIAGYVAKHVKDLVTNNPYARVTHWNIGDNVLQNWRKNESTTNA